MLDRPSDPVENWPHGPLLPREWEETLAAIDPGAPKTQGLPGRTGKDGPIASDVIAEADGYPSLLAGLVARRKELGLSQSTLDDLAGLTNAYTSKLECGMKRMGAMSLDSLLGALGVKLVLVRTTPHHLRQRRVMGASRGTVRHGPTPADRAA